jgi:hypothetical protein
MEKSIGVFSYQFFERRTNMAIKTYSKGKATQLSTNFKSTEFDCHGSGCCSTTQVDEKLV